MFPVLSWRRTSANNSLFLHTAVTQHVFTTACRSCFKLSVVRILPAVIHLAALLITRCVLLAWLCTIEHLEIGISNLILGFLKMGPQLFYLDFQYPQNDSHC